MLAKPQPVSFSEEVMRVLTHARWPVQSYVVLGFLFGAVITKTPLTIGVFIAFFAWLNLVAGLTVLNSYYDKDEAPVGGMKNPPKVTKSLLYGSLIMLALGMGISTFFGLTFFLLGFSMVFLYFFYSYEGTRWKGNGYMAITINAVVGAITLLGAAALGGNEVLTTPVVVLSTICAAFFKASVYSMMQVHQIEEDTERGDISFAVMHGRQTTLRFSQITMIIGTVFALAGLALMNISPLIPILGGVYFIGAVIMFERWIRQTENTSEEDAEQMQRMIVFTGYLGSIAFFLMYVVMNVMGII